MALNPEEFFSFLEYIIADAGYGALWWLCTPYKNPVAQEPDYRVFNQLFSSGRVRIEHLNGILKNRFSSLKGLPHQIKKAEHFQNVAYWIQACITLHNLLIDFNDEWDDIDPPEDTEEEAEAFHGTIPPQWSGANADGNQLRLRVKAHILNWFYNN